MCTGGFVELFSQRALLSADLVYFQGRIHTTVCELRLFLRAVITPNVGTGCCCRTRQAHNVQIQVQCHPNTALK